MNWHALFAALSEGKTVVAQTPRGSDRLRLDRHAGLMYLAGSDGWLELAALPPITAFEVEAT